MTSLISSCPIMKTKEYNEENGPTRRQERRGEHGKETEKVVSINLTKDGSRLSYLYLFF